MAKPKAKATPKLITLNSILPANPDTKLPPPPKGYSSWLTAALSGHEAMVDDFVFRNARHEVSLMLYGVLALAKQGTE